MPVCKLQNDFCGLLVVFIKLFLIMHLCTRCLYTSVGLMLVYPTLCLDNGFSLCCCAPKACTQASEWFWLTVLYIHKTVPHHAVVHQMLVNKLQDDATLSCLVSNKLFLIMLLSTKCLYTSFITILVYGSLCSSNCF